MPTSLVTGGAGFIGAHLASALLAQGHRVVILDDLSGGFESNLPTKAEFVSGSILDTALVDRVFSENNFDYVFHLAAYAAEGLSHFIRRFNYQNNLIGSANLINAAVNAQVKRFVFTSSIAVYGASTPPLRESTPAQPEDPYGIAKLAVEMDLRCAHEMFGLDYTIFRPHNVYGPLQNIADRYRNVVGIFMNQALGDLPFTVFGDGSQTRAFTWIDDILPPMVSCVTNPESANQIFNLGSDTPHTVLELAERVSQSLNRPLKINQLEARNEVQFAWSDHQKLQSVFGPQPQTPLAEGIDQMATWVKSRGPAIPTPFMPIEISRNLPPSWRPPN